MVYMVTTDKMVSKCDEELKETLIVTPVEVLGDTRHYFTTLGMSLCDSRVLKPNSVRLNT